MAPKPTKTWPEKDYKMSVELWNLSLQVIYNDELFCPDITKTVDWALKAMTNVMFNLRK